MEEDGDASWMNLLPAGGAAEDTGEADDETGADMDDIIATEVEEGTGVDAAIEDDDGALGLSQSGGSTVPSAHLKEPFSIPLQTSDCESDFPSNSYSVTVGPETSTVLATSGDRLASWRW